MLIKLERLGCTKQMFIAQTYGLPITLEQQIGILLLMLLTSKGAATVGNLLPEDMSDANWHPAGVVAR